MGDSRIRVDQRTKERVGEMARRENLSTGDYVKGLVDRAWEGSDRRLHKKDAGLR
jgi:hypothetical protein